MSFFPDMGCKSMVASGGHVRAIGWLHPDHAYTKGQVPTEFLARLKEFVQQANGNGTTQAVFSSICAGDLTIGLKSALDTFQAACGGIIL